MWKLLCRHCIALGMVVFVACQPRSLDTIEGDWKAIELSEEGDSLAVNLLEDVSFLFKENGRYHFQSTLKYEEAGIFYINGPFLFSTDTTRNNAEEKAVEILQLNGDTLILRMKEQEKERVMVLIRNKF